MVGKNSSEMLVTLQILFVSIFIRNGCALWLVGLQRLKEMGKFIFHQVELTFPPRSYG